MNLSTGRKQALHAAQNYLRQRNINPSEYKTAAVSTFEGRANRYLQKTIGFEKLKYFTQEHNFDLFFWIIRFFKEQDKEEYRLTIGSSTGRITSFSHIIDNTEERSKITEEEAKKRTVDFLKKTFNFNPDLYILKNNVSVKHDNREDFSFTWQKQGVNIPWSEEKDSGTGKLLIGATVSGNEILSFYNNNFSVPEKFNRYLDRQKNTGQNLSTIVKVFYYILFVSSIFFVASRRNHLSMHSSKNFYLMITLISFLLSLLSNLNHFQYTLFNYKTTIPFNSFLWRFWTNTIIDSIFLSVAILMPSLAGESLHYEELKNKPQGSFLHSIRSAFFTRSAAQLILLGYCVCLIMLGIQSFLIEIGQKYWGVWIEQGFRDNLSTSYLPFLAAFTLGYKASFSEELMFRLFAISWGKKVFKNLFIAAFLSSLLWGFAHSNYSVFPMWFRGIEVSCLGLFLSWVYLRYGIITVITAHYLFDVFWHSAGYLLGISQPFYFYSSLLVLLLPLFFALAAFALNKSETERRMFWKLNKHQLYNLGVLKTFLKIHPEEFLNKSSEEVKHEIVSHGWDMAVVEKAVDEVQHKKNKIF